MRIVTQVDELDNGSVYAQAVIEGEDGQIFRRGTKVIVSRATDVRVMAAEGLSHAFELLRADLEKETKNGTCVP